MPDFRFLEVPKYSYKIERYDKFKDTLDFVIKLRNDVFGWQAGQIYSFLNPMVFSIIVLESSKWGFFEKKYRKSSFIRLLVTRKLIVWIVKTLI